MEEKEWGKLSQLVRCGNYNTYRRYIDQKSVSLFFQVNHSSFPFLFFIQRRHFSLEFLDFFTGFVNKLNKRSTLNKLRIGQKRVWRFVTFVIIPWLTKELVWSFHDWKRISLEKAQRNNLSIWNMKRRIELVKGIQFYHWTSLSMTKVFAVLYMNYKHQTELSYPKIEVGQKTY